MYFENMEFSFNKDYIEYNLDNIVCIFVCCFFDSFIFVIKFFKMIFYFFSVYKNFLNFFDDGILFIGYMLGNEYSVEGLMYFVCFYNNVYC